MTNAAQGRIDPDVVAALYREHGTELRAFLTGVLRDHDLAGEALQLTFKQALETGHSARSDTLKGWLFQVALHAALALRRRKAIHDKTIQQLAWQVDTLAESPEEQLTRAEAVEEVRQALQNLPPEQQIVVRKRIYDQQTFAAIAAELALPLGTVLTRMRSALKKLQQQLDRNR